MTRALVTGVTGFVGSHLAEYLIANTDWNVIGMTRWRSPLDNIESLVPLINEGRRMRLVYADLRDDIAVRNAVDDADADYVFHLAAQSYPQTSFSSPLDTIDTNTNGTVRLLEAVRQHRKHQGVEREKPIVHVCSSSEVYGRSEKVPIDESAPFHPASPYAVSKVGADLMARHYAEAYGMNVQVTRMFTHTGARRGDVFMEATFAKQIAMIEAGMIPPVVKVGNLKSLRTVADVRDAARAYHLVVTVDPQPGAVYNIGGSYTCTVGEILDKLMEMAGCRYAVEEDPARMRPVDADRQVPNCGKFKAHTGWEPEIPFERTMADLLAFWRERVKRGAVLQR